MNDKSPIFHSLVMIEEKIQGRLTVEMLAEGIHFSKYHYQRIFREAVGDTVMGYVARRRLYLAAGELAETKRSVLEIALRYGYDSHEGFTRSFKAHTGVTPTEYRKYHSAIRFPKRRKEQCTMESPKHMDELTKALNSLIVQAKETAAETKKFQKSNVQAVAFYGQFWEFAAVRAEKMAEELENILNSAVTAVWGADEISTRFLLVKAIDSIAFDANVTAFHVGLMIARAMPEHQVVFQPLCACYDRLAQNARIKSRKMAEFLYELFDLILQDMRKQAKQKIQSAVDSGRAAAEMLSNPALPYGYIADGIMAIAKGLHSLALEDVTLSSLTDAACTLETIRFAAYLDILRVPQHRQLFDGVSDFKEKLDEAAKFFRDLTGDSLRTLGETENDSGGDIIEKRIYKNLSTQEGVVLFCLKGEIQKLGDAHLNAKQKTALNAICNKIDGAIKASHSPANEYEKNKVMELLCEAYDELMREAKELGPYGGAIQYLAQKGKMPLNCLMEKS